VPVKCPKSRSSGSIDFDLCRTGRVMNSVSPPLDRKKLFQVRPTFLLACVAVLAALGSPGAIRGHQSVQRVLLLFAGVAIASGWFFLFRDRERNTTWRASIALVTSIYLTVSIPAYCFAFFATFWWIFQHRAVWIFLRPWASWGDVLVDLGVAGSFFGRGRTRIAFLVGSILLLILRESTGKWI
jgi:hypothetical protein